MKRKDEGLFNIIVPISSPSFWFTSSLYIFRSQSSVRTLTWRRMHATTEISISEWRFHVLRDAHEWEAFWKHNPVEENSIRNRLTWRRLGEIYWALRTGSFEDSVVCGCNTRELINESACSGAGLFLGCIDATRRTKSNLKGAPLVGCLVLIIKYVCWVHSRLECLVRPKPCSCVRCN
jgi:hypothetical protein